MADVPASPTACAGAGDSLSATKLNKVDFEFGDQLGEGAYGRVVKASLKSNKAEQYAIKIVNKAMVVRTGKVNTVKSEKEILTSLSHPNIIQLKCTFQDEENLYFVLELADKGELFYYIRKYGPCSLEAAQFYAAEVILALEYLHSKGIIHRDLKPENILLDKNWHVKLTDFGTAKAVDESAAETRGTFVGTAQYVAPETLEKNVTTRLSDLWALGCVIFQMVAGKPPFEGESEYLVFQKILGLDYAFPENTNEAAKDIITRLLQKDPSSRIGKESYAELKQHPFFQGLDWDAVAMQVPPALERPEVDAAIAMSRMRASSVVEASEQAKWAPFLLQNEKIMELGNIIKRRKMTAKKRTLILTDLPRIFYVDGTSMEQKGEIPWSPDLWVQMKNDRDFVIHTPNRDYILEDVDNKANRWAKAINKLKTSLK